MLKFFKIVHALGFFLMFMSCASTNSPRYLKNGKVVTGDYTKYQNNYSLKILDNWSGYFDIHSQFPIYLDDSTSMLETFRITE